MLQNAGRQWRVLLNFWARSWQMVTRSGLIRALQKICWLLWRFDHRFSEGLRSWEGHKSKISTWWSLRLVASSCWKNTQILTKLCQGVRMLPCRQNKKLGLTFSFSDKWFSRCPKQLEGGSETITSHQSLITWSLHFLQNFSLFFFPGRSGSFAAIIFTRLLPKRLFLKYVQMRSHLLPVLTSVQMAAWVRQGDSPGTCGTLLDFLISTLQQPNFPPWSPWISGKLFFPPGVTF